MSVETGSMQTRTLAIANRKGGTGKSTLTVNLAAELGSRGYRVLVVDIDPQGHAGLGFGIRSTDAENTSHVAFRKPWADLIAAVRRTSEPGVDLIAADRDFDGAIAVADPRCLAKALQPVKPHYNVVLLDSPPAAANVMVCALLAADGVLVPTALDYLALDGVRLFARSYHQVMLHQRATLLGLAIAPMQVDFRRTSKSWYCTNCWRDLAAIRCCAVFARMSASQKHSATVNRCGAIARKRAPSKTFASWPTT